MMQSIKASLKEVPNSLEERWYFQATKGPRTGATADPAFVLSRSKKQLRKDGVYAGVYMKLSCRMYSTNGEDDNANNGFTKVMVCKQVLKTVDEVKSEYLKITVNITG